MSMRILGPMDTGGPSLSPRERTILTALIVRRDAAVTPAELAEACWGEEPPATWAQQVRNAVAKIRSKLGADAVRTVGVDYRLGLDADAIDAVQFEQGVAQARRQALQGSHDRAAAGFRRALALWRGTPLPDAADWPPAVIEAARLVEVRRSAEEELLDARLAAGERGAVIADAERLVREEPLREHRWAILALANYRADRQAEAIAVIRGARERLSNDLGIDPSRSLVDLETAMLRQDPDLEAPAVALAEREVSEACPYRGLAAYGDGDRELFFGRDADIEEVLARCGRQSVVTVVGPSGSGKSSLVRAGVVPRLRDQGRSVVIVTPSGTGAEQLRAAFAGSAAVICIDQAEEFRMLPADELRDIGVRSAEWVEHGGCLVLALRSDFLDGATAISSLGPLIGRGLYALPPLAADGLREAITRPAEAAGLELESGLVEVILRDAGDRPGILPPLSHALVATWTRREGATLTVDGYETSGGIAGAIAQSAEQVFQGLSPARQDVCRSLMMRLVERTPEGMTVRRRVPLATLSTNPQRRAVVEGLVRARLVTIDGDAAIIAHEAVGTTWPRLDGWLTEDAANARILRQVEVAAAAWDAAGRPDDDLLRGARLHGASEWREEAQPDLTPVEATYLDASIERHEAELRELEARSARDRSRNRWLRSALVAAAVLLLVAVVSGGIAVVRGSEASAAAEDATIEALAATSLAIRDSDRDVAALLAAELQRRWPDDSRARSALLGNLTGGDGLVARHWIGEGTRANGAVVPGTRTALIVEDRLTDAETSDTATEPSSVRVIDLDTGETLREFDVEMPTVNFQFERDVFVSGDGSTGFIQTGEMRRPNEDSCCKNHFVVIDLATGLQPFPTLTYDDRTGQIPVLTEDGSRAYFNHPITGDPGWIDLRTGEITQLVEHDPAEFEGNFLRTNGLALVDDRLYTTGDTGIGIYDAETLEPIGMLGDVPSGYADLTLVPDQDGGVIASGDEGVVRVDLATGAELWRRESSEMRCVNAAIVPPDKLACINGVGLLRTFDLANGRPTGVELDTLSDWNRGVEVIGDSGELVTFTSRSPAAVLVWRTDGRPSTTRVIAEDRIAIGGFGMDDSMLITAPAPPPLVETVDDMQLWDITADEGVGAEAFEMTWVTDRTIAVSETGIGDPVLQDVGSDETREIDMPDSAGGGWWIPAERGGPHVFAVTQGGMMMIDPETGATGPLIETEVNPLMDAMDHAELGDSGRMTLTWWDQSLGRSFTSVYDIETGEELARGLEDDVDVVGLPNGDALSASASRLNRSTGDLEPVHSLPKSGVAPLHMEVSADGRTLLASGWDQSLTLYDLDDARRLGDEIQMPGGPNVWWPSGFISRDGTMLATNAAEGVLLWEIGADAMRDAACRMVGRDLTELEWSTYFGDEPYVATCTGTGPAVEASD